MSATYEVILKQIGQYIDMIELGDDYGIQTGLFISRELYLKFIHERNARMISTIKKYTDAKIYFHSDGSVSEIVNDLIDSGVDILNPVQPYVYDMEPSSMKKRFGKRICFHGGIDQQYYLPKASREELVEEVKRVIRAYAPGGGYILAAAHNIQGDVPVENLVAMLDAAREFGKYPIPS